MFRGAILDAAEAVFAERGFERARIQDIAERARTAVGTVYNHFSHKEEVLSALLDERSRGFVEEISARPGDPKRFAAKLEVRLARGLSFMEQHQGFFILAMEHGLVGAPTAAAEASLKSQKLLRMKRGRAALVALVEEGVKDGTLEDVGAERLARLLGALMKAWLLDAVEAGAADLADEAKVLVDLFLHGAAKRRSKAR